MNQIQKIVTSAILCNTKGEVLLAKRPVTKKIAPGKYHLPGGHVEFGESVESALVREMKEEFQLDVEVRGIVRTFSYTYDTTHTIGITFCVVAELLPEVIWFDPQDTEEVIWVNKESIRQYLDQDDHDYVTLERFFSSSQS